MESDLDVSLISTVQSGRIKLCREVIKNHENLHFWTTSMGYKLLCSATQKNRKEIAKLLILKGCRVKFTNYFFNKFRSNTPLHFAVGNGDIEIVEMLLNRGALIDAVNYKRETPLCLAVKKNNKAIVKLLIENGANIDKYHDGLNLLHIATDEGYFEIVKLLIKCGANINCKALSPRKGYTPLHFTILDGDKKQTPLLLNISGIPDIIGCDNERPLCVPVNIEKSQIIEYLLQQGADASVSEYVGYTPLHFATAFENLIAVKLLLDYNVDINSAAADGKTALHIATEIKYGKIVGLLLSKGADVNAKDVNGETPLHIAVSLCSEEFIETLLKFGADANSKYSSTPMCGFSPLHLAARNGDHVIVKLLLHYGGDINLLAKRNKSLLHLAAESGDGKTVGLLLSTGTCADVNARDDYNLTPLHLAALKQYTPLQDRSQQNRDSLIIKPNPVVLLLENGADIDAQDICGTTVLYTAVRLGNVAFVKYILSYCPSTTNKGNQSSLKIAVCGYTKIFSRIVGLLLEYGFTVGPDDKEDGKFMYFCVVNGYETLIEQLVSYGADFNPKHDKILGETFMFLHCAVGNKHEKIVKILINNNVDVNVKDYKGGSPLLYAVFNNDLNIIKLLINSGAEINGDICILHIAVEMSCLEAVRFVLQYYSCDDVNIPDEDGRTALHFVSVSQTNKINFHSFVGFMNKRITSQSVPLSHYDRDQSEIAKLLIIKGANVDACTKKGLTALHMAVESRLEKVVSTLLEYNASVNCFDIDGRTPLHISSKFGYNTICKILLTEGADLNVAQNDGMTALHIATFFGRKETVKFLLKSEASVLLKDKMGRTSFNVAVERCHSDISKILLDFDRNNDDVSRNECHYIMEYGSITMQNAQTRTRPLDSFDIASIISEHISKINCFDFPVVEDVMQLLQLHNIISDKSWSKFSDCKRELLLLMNHEVCSNVSLCDILTKNLSTVSVFIKNENVKKLLKSINFDESFPIYGNMLYNQLIKAKDRILLLEQCNTILYSHNNWFSKLPYECTEKILSNLTNKDLQSFVDEFSNINVRQNNCNVNDYFNRESDKEHL